jgi:hypothetical protein
VVLDLVVLEFYFLLRLMDIIMPVVAAAEVGQHREEMAVQVEAAAQQVVRHQVDREEVPDRAEQVEVREQQVQLTQLVEQPHMEATEVQIPVAVVAEDHKRL